MQFANEFHAYFASHTLEQIRVDVLLCSEQSTRNRSDDDHDADERRNEFEIARRKHVDYISAQKRRHQAYRRLKQHDDEKQRE